MKIKSLRIKVFSCIVTISVFLSLLNGCTKVNQLHERLIVQGIGVDVIEDGYEITLHVFDDINTGIDESEKIEVITGKGESVLDAFTNVSLKTGREPLYSQNLILVIGLDAAKAGIENIIDFFIRYYEARPGVSIFVAQSSAKSIMTSKYNDQPITAMKISALAGSGDINAKLLESNVVNVTNNLYGNLTDVSIMSIRSENTNDGDNIIADATAVFRGDKLVGFLDDIHTRGMLLINGNINGGTFSVDVDDKTKATLMFNKVKSDFNVITEGDNLKIISNIDVTADLYSLDSSVKTKYPGEYLEEIENVAKVKLTKECEDTINSAVMGLGSDVFNFGKITRLHEPNYFKTIDENWHSIMKETEYEINLNVSINKIGQEMNPY